MKISTLILSFCGFCILYICNADWIDELIEDYLGGDYEEVAPFVSSVTAGTEEFDQLVEELSQSKRRWWVPHPLILVMALCALSLTILLHYHTSRMCQGHGVIKKAFQFLTNFRNSGKDKEEIQTIVTEFLERKLKQLCGNKQTNVIPVKLLWKGGTLVESSIHCNLREDSTFRHVHRHLLQPELLFKPSDEGKGEAATLTSSSSETSTARKMVEIRKLLESEQELEKFLDKKAGMDDKSEGHASQPLTLRNPQQTSTLRCDDEIGNLAKPNEKLQIISKENLKKKMDQCQKEELSGNLDSDLEGLPDQKLMNRIRLLESRLRLEELKNKNWINRMSRAEGILQQLNKQVERIEEARPMGTLTETLKITSTVTNWTSSSNPRRNMQFTLVNQYPPFYTQAPYTSLSELIKKEVGLPTPCDFGRNPFHLSPTPQIPALPSPTVIPQSSFLSKFLCR